MARNLNVIVFMLLTVANLLHGSVAQTKHVVGDATGWTIPSNGAPFYVNWASNKTFTVGDTLVFNFANGQHDVAKVTKSDLDSCNGAKTISLLTNGPASVTLNETGQQYFICTFGTHCSLGQKLSINVVKKASTTSSPPVSAPQPSASSSPPKSTPVPAPSKAPALAPTQTPTPTPAPSPTHVSGGVNYTVGDIIGWTIPSNGASAYTTWASGKSFKVGDVLVFNFAFTAHNVEQVTKANYDSCNSASPIATFSKPPVRITLNKTGTHYFICGFSGHCSAGQKLSINVGAKTTSPATSPSPTAASPSPSADSPSSSPSSIVNPSSQSPNGAVSPPPENSGAVSVGVAGLFVTVLSIAAAFFC